MSVSLKLIFFSFLKEIKDLYNKMGHCDKYIRLAIRNETDNNKLVAALKKVLENDDEI